MLVQTPVHDAAGAELQAMQQALAVLVLSPDGTIVRANANFLQLSGYKARDLIGQPRSMFVPPRAADAAADAALWDTVRAGASQDIECPRLRKGGALIWVRSSYQAVVDADGTITAVVEFATDVTETKRRTADDRGQITAINSSQAVIHFALDGSITHANQRFLDTMGYSLAEVAGQHHRMFVEPGHARSKEYAAFWQTLAQGRHHTGIYKRLGKDGRAVWLQATYTPIVDMNGHVFKVVKYATDITADTLRRVDQAGQIEAIDKSHGVITFDMHGTVLHANDNFLQAMGYRLEEIEGRHHRMFVDPSFAHGPEYAAFWSRLAEGQHQAGEYRRFGKNGREVWLQASYNPIPDLNGKPCKVVKYATAVTREKLRQADHQGQIASIHKAQCVVSFELDGTVIDANDNFLDTTGYRLTEVRGQNHRMFVDAASVASPAYAAFWADLARGQHKAAEFKRLCKGGREIWLQASYNPIFDMNGRPFKVVTYATDVTQDRLLQADNQGQIDAIQKSQCVVAFAMDGTILQANDNFLAAMGYTRGAVEGRHHRMFFDEAFAASDEYRMFWDTLRAGEFLTGKYRRIGNGGKEVWIQASYNPIFDLNGRPFKVIKIATDVTADVALAADFVTARRQAQQDVATALPNRAGLMQLMAAALAHPSSRLAILYLDLDHFKPINDTYGHDIGDLVLRETARRLVDAIGPGQMAARIGGDEFVVAAVDLLDEQIDALCLRLIQAVQAPIRHDNCMLSVGLSIGVAVAPQDAVTADDLMRCADVALYRTKGNGRGGYSCYASDMTERLSVNRHLAEEMRHGIKAGQFALDFRTRADARTRRVHSAEALVYWDHPARGRLLPGEFIALAEQSGLILPLGEWVLRNACHAAVDWHDIGVCVKVSPTQFAGTDFAHTVATALAESGLAPHLLELEIAERMLADDAPRARDALQALRALGVRLMLEDYGAQHGGLDSVRAFALDSVAIDPRFIADIDSETDGRRIVADLHRLRDAMKPESGDDAAAQLLVLDLDAQAQVHGYHLGQPMPRAALATLLMQQQQQQAHGQQAHDKPQTGRARAAARA